MALDREQPVYNPKGESLRLSARPSSPITRRRNIMAHAALAVILQTAACAGDQFEIGEAAAPDSGADTAMDSGTTDAPDLDSAADADADPVDSGNDAKLDAPSDGPDAATSCSKSGTVVYDPSMGCYKEGIDRGGVFLPPPESSENTATCQSGTCANSPVNADLDVLWVQEGTNTGKFSSTKTPVAYNAHCLSYTALTPPTMTQLHSDLALPTGWITPTVGVVGKDYTLNAPSCAGSSVVYVMQYGP